MHYAQNQNYDKKVKTKKERKRPPHNQVNHLGSVLFSSKWYLRARENTYMLFNPYLRRFPSVAFKRIPYCVSAVTDSIASHNHLLSSRHPACTALILYSAPFSKRFCFSCHLKCRIDPLCSVSTGAVVSKYT